MKQLFFLLTLALTCSAFAQRQYNNMFANDAALDTVTQAARTVTTEKIVFGNPWFTKLDGMVNTYGYLRVISGSDTTLNIRARLWFGANAESPSPWYDLTAVADAGNTAGDTTFFVISLARQTFWTDCSGYEIEYSIPAGGTRTLEIQSKSTVR